MLEVEDWGKVTGLNQGKKFIGVFQPRMTVRCYTVDGLLIDSGPHFTAKEVLAFSLENKVHSAIITHHHEDHSGNSKVLADSNIIKVFSSAKTKRIISKGFHCPLYQRLIWGRAPTTDKVLAIGSTIETENYTFNVISAPGHCEDQIVLFEKSQGWLFTGDAFLANKIKYFRADEDYNQMLGSLINLSQLPVETLFCAHHPVPIGGQKALQEKLSFMLELKSMVEELYFQRGYTIAEISKRTLGREEWSLFFLSFGDFCKRNVISSIIKGPRIRKEFKKLFKVTEEDAN